MTNKINVLPEHIANKIAAGEVVQRPESVVKEILENAIDAGAKNIEIYIKTAGKNLVQIVDDGFGMSEEDASLSVQRHATSKVFSIEDLEAIKTFGFRGEALSSIAAVSRFEIRTKTEDSELGTIIKFEDDKILSKEKAAVSQGTSIIVKNLFYNVPARRNFLKSNATELKHIIDTFKRTAISNPDISFKFINDDDLLYDLPAGDLSKRLSTLFADNILDGLIDLNEPTEFISVKGFVSKPTFIKKNRADQYLFVNGRYVQSRNINHAVFSAYENVLQKGEYPFFILFVEIDPRKIDINIHPQKLEIKFDDETAIYSMVQAVVKKNLSKYDFVPSANFTGSIEGEEKFNLSPFTSSPRNDFSDRPTFNQGNSKQSSGGHSKEEIDMLFNSLNPEIKRQAPDSPVPHPFDRPVQSKEVMHVTTENEDSGSFNTSFIVALHNKYILSQIKSGLMIIDAHVAHERILYEKALASFNANMPFSQQLLFPQKLRLDAGDYALLKELNEYLTGLGFALKFSTGNTIIITGVPSDVKIGSEIKTLTGIIDEFKYNQREKGLEERDNLAKSYSCKAAIKAGDKLSDQEMRLLVDQLFATSMPYVCPHGRPIVIKISLDEFDKRFGRT